MKVACPSCNSSLTIDDKKIPAGGARIKCPTCQTIFPVKPGMSSGAVPLPGGAAPASSSSGAVPLPGLSAAKPSPTSWEDAPTRVGTPGAVPLPGAAGPSDWETAPTRAMPASGAVPLPGSAAFPGSTQRAPPPSNVPKPSTRSGIAVPLPGISAAKPAATSWDDEATRVGDATGAAPAGVDLDFSVQTTAAMPKLGAVPLPGASSGVRPSTVDSIPLPGASTPSGLRSSPGAVPLPGSSASGARSNAGSVPLPGASSSSGMRSNPAAVPLPGAVSGGDDLEAGFGSPPTNRVPLPGASHSAATQAVPALQTDEVPFSDDFGEAPLPQQSNAASADFGFPDLPGDSAPGFDPPQSSGSGFDFDAAPPPAASTGFDFDAPAAPPPVSGGGFDFGAPPPAAAQRRWLRLRGTACCSSTAC